MQPDKVFDGDGRQSDVKCSVFLLILAHVVLQSGLQVTPLLQEGERNLEGKEWRRNGRRYEVMMCWQ